MGYPDCDTEPKIVVDVSENLSRPILFAANRAVSMVPLVNLAALMFGISASVNALPLVIIPLFVTTTDW